MISNCRTCGWKCLLFCSQLYSINIPYSERINFFFVSHSDHPFLSFFCDIFNFHPNPPFFYLYKPEPTTLLWYQVDLSFHRFHHVELFWPGYHLFLVLTHDISLHDSHGPTNKWINNHMKYKYCPKHNKVENTYLFNLCYRFLCPIVFISNIQNLCHAHQDHHLECSSKLLIGQAFP